MTNVQRLELTVLELEIRLSEMTRNFLVLQQRELAAQFEAKKAEVKAAEDKAKEPVVETPS